MNKRFYKTIILPIILWVVTFPVYASEYGCDADTVDFNEGDVLSSEVFSEMINKINNNIVGISQSELNASWSCKTILERGEGTNNGFSVDANGFYTMTQTLTFTEVDSFKSRVIYENSFYGGSPHPAQDCTVSILANKIKFKNTTGSGNSGSCQNNPGVYGIVKKSSTCFEMGQINDSVIICNKTDIAPDAPLNLFVSLTSTQGTNNKKASLVWEAGDSTQNNYDVQRKNTVDGTFTSIATPTDTNYTDTAITWNNTYWYRVFAINADGTSYGSNVKKITYSNTPPSMNLASTLSVNENSTSILYVNASDADSHTLTYSIASQSPGNDASFMTINSTGDLSFNSSPDYEDAGDYDSNNIYDITVSVSDGYDTVSQDVGVVVLDVSEQKKVNEKNLPLTKIQRKQN